MLEIADWWKEGFGEGGAGGWHFIHMVDVCG